MPKELKEELDQLRNTVDRISAEIPLLALRRNARPEVVKDDGVKDLIDNLRRDYSEYFRNERQPKKDNYAQVIGSIMGVIALISAMTAIIQPMNRSIDEIRTAVKENKIEYDRNLTRLEERFDGRILRLEQGDVEDKKINAMVEIMFSQQKSIQP